ncbi:MAG: ABC transporter ATP-binding protein, partial [Bacteroidetes bacterium]|nr:ABC transporter ATP-binding protein [Bacteroidota bacterium]
EEKGTALWVITHDEKVLTYLNCKSFKLSEKQLFETSPTKKEATHLDQNAFGDKMVLDVQNLGFSYPKSDNGFTDVSFNLHEGEILGVVGQSGSGKSTLAKALVKVFSANGCITPNYPTGRVQLIFQSPDAALDPLQRVGKCMMEVVRIHHKLSKNDRRAKALELMQQVGLNENHFNRLPHQLSGGQKQRICIAKALACQPKVLICDECVSSLDADIKHQILALLQSLSITQNVGIVFITHDIGLIKGFAHNVLVMANGQVVESGNAQQVFNEPETDATKALLAALL